MGNPMVHRIVCLGLLSLFVSGLLACDVEPGESSSHREIDSDAPTIVSLSPAVTRMLIDMGKRDQIVGVAEYDDPSLGVPVCGSYQQPMIARIAGLKPSMVLTESPTGKVADVPELLRTLSAEGAFELKVIPHCRSVADVERALIDAEVGLGVAVGDPDAAERARRLMLLRIKLMHAVVKKSKRPRTLMLINPTTLGAIGTEVTHDELLRLAGGGNAMGHVRIGYPTLDRAQLQQTARPEVVLIFEPGGSELRDGDARLRAFEGLSIPVTTSRRFAVIDHPNAMLPSTSLPEVMLEMALILHPDKAAALQDAYDAAGLIVAQENAKGEAGS